VLSIFYYTHSSILQTTHHSYLAEEKKCFSPQRHIPQPPILDPEPILDPGDGGDDGGDGDGDDGGSDDGDESEEDGGGGEE
jgi:hypothetical protein